MLSVVRVWEKYYIFSPILRVNILGLFVPMLWFLVWTYPLVEFNHLESWNWGIHHQNGTRNLSQPCYVWECRPSIQPWSPQVQTEFLGQRGTSKSHEVVFWVIAGLSRCPWWVSGPLCLITSWSCLLPFWPVSSQTLCGSEALFHVCLIFTPTHLQLFLASFTTHTAFPPPPDVSRGAI